MKYAIIIPDGCADEPQESLGGKTPLQAARTPNMDRLAQMGVVGRANNVPPGLTPASDVATLSLFGYDPSKVYTGRSPLEAAAMGIKLGGTDWAIRCNLVNVEDGLMRDFTAGHISSEEGRELIAQVNEVIGGEYDSPDLVNVKVRMEFHPGVGYRHCLVYRTSGLPAPFEDTTKTQPPHDIPDQPVADYLPSGPGGDLMRALMEHSKQVLADHPVNQQRRAAGKRPATQIWLWGQGRAPQLVPFVNLHRKHGAIISGVDLVRGVGILIGWKRLDVPGVTDYLDNDYAAQGQATLDALKSYDVVCAHVEAPDEASHEGRADEKVKALERIDEQIVGPLLEKMPYLGDWRILVSPDHRTPLRTRAHAHGAVPFVIAGTGIQSKGQATYDEVVAAASDLAFDPGHQLMRFFLG
ncbi:MAG: cofactor-independent phosphoglycerate mutase [Planctomycetia bacterium]|nr:cofactor-independent phosphoglycerate mutase [Planctomycetia bacterium]